MKAFPVCPKKQYFLTLFALIVLIVDFFKTEGMHFIQKPLTGF